jgi:hypothetical protein
MKTCERILISCRDVAPEALGKQWLFLTEDEYNACQRKLHDRSGHDTPEDKMYFNKLSWEVRKRDAGSLFASRPERFTYRESSRPIRAGGR